MTREEVDRFEKIHAQIGGLYKEIGLLSKKNPNDAVNKFKLKFMNQLLTEANNLLTDDYKPLKGFDIFDDDDLPTNSDVTFVFEQYLNCMEKLRSDNVEQDFGSWHWIIDGQTSNIRTATPKKLTGK